MRGSDGFDAARRIDGGVLKACAQLLLGALFAVDPAAAITVAGHTAGQFHVGESGAATYAIPIAAAPGTAGVEPQLALSYNSQGNNSLLGVGWSLAGLSVVSRCPATLAQDGFVDAVDFDANDRLCLDGERLMAVGGVYGADATEYRTEQDTFRRIVSRGYTGGGPEEIVVETKDGLLFEYGGTSNSRIEAQGKTSVLFWAVNRIADTKGNYLAVSYVEENGDYRPARIDYTANDAAGLAAYASVRFVYEPRPDAVPRFIGGSGITIGQRLIAIQAYEDEQPYREYRLSYEVSEASGRSRLASVTECGSNGDCFSPTVFAWQSWAASDFNFNGAGTGMWAGHGGGSGNNFLGDFNGDGKTDAMGYAFTPAGRWHVVFSAGSSFSGGGFWSGHAGGPSNNVLGDFNGDGKTDAMGYAESTGKWHVTLSTGSGFDGAGGGMWKGTSGGPSNSALGDFNGDGRTDVMGRTSVAGQWWVGLSSGTDFDATGSGTWTGHRGRVGDNFIGDFDGDGRSDSLGYTGVADQWHVALSDGTSFNAPGSGIWRGHRGVASNNFLGDYNGDGKTDIMGYTGSQGLWHVSLSSGADFDAPGSGNWHGHTGGSGNNFLGDFNGDGMTDIARYKSGGVWTVCLSLGTDFSCRDWAGHGGGASNNFLGDFDGDGKTDMMGYAGNGVWHTALAGGPATDLVAGVADGHGLLTTIVYASLAETTAYSRGSAAVYPEQDFAGGLQVVTSYATSNGIGGVSTFFQSYSGAKVDLTGRGFRGFERTSVTDPLTGIVTTVHYEHDSKYTSTKVRRTEQRQADGRLISEVDNINEVRDHGFGIHFSFVGTSVSKRYELDGSLVSAVTTTTDVDDHGNVTSLTIDYGDGVSERTTSTYADNVDRWLLGRLTRATVTKTAIGRATQTRTSAFTYDAQTGLLTAEIIEPDHPFLRLVKSYAHDIYGKVAVSTTSGPGIVARATATAADARGRYVTRSANSLGHVETKDYALASLITLTGPNRLTTRWEHDGFGRETRQLRADGTETRTAYLRCASACPAHAVYFVRKETTGAPTNTTYYDLLDREVRGETTGFDGTPIYVDVVYDARGLRRRVSEPYFAGGTPPWTESTFDLVGRVLHEVAPGGRVTTTAHQGLTTRITNSLGQVGLRTVDVRGKLVASTDHAGNTVSYAYDAFGNMVEMRSPAGHVTTLTYDVRGNRTSIVDPDTGRTTFTHDPLGQVIAQTDANRNTVTFAYDDLGRLVTRVEPDGTSNWIYDSPGTGLGRLIEARRGDYVEAYFYDSLGRLELTRITIAGVPFSFTNSYDGLGRPSTLVYPTGLGVRTEYNAYGYPVAVRRIADDRLLWRADAMNARGQLTRATLGNDLVTTRDFDSDSGRVQRIRTSGAQDLSFAYDALGNLQSRRDELRGLSESFTYDALNRLTSSQVNGQPAVTIGYDAVGNVTSRSDVGIYVYGQDGAGPHAVTTVSGPRGGTFLYDANGNLVRRQRLTLDLGSANGAQTAVASIGEAATLTYTSSNKLRSITEGSTALTFDYGPDYDRYRQIVRTAAGVTTKLYVGGVFERETTGSVVRDLHYLQAAGETFAVAVGQTNGGPAATSTRYLHRDHLGSLQTITGDNGTVVEVLAFDAWGLRRNAQTWGPATAVPTPTLDRGFTGHEHLDEVSLIHMNGRVYDPVIGRFLSADPFVQAPEDTQSLNRYSYALNNPLSLTDPSGYFLRGLRRFFSRVFQSTIGRAAISIVVGFLAQGWAPALWQALGGTLSAGGIGATIVSGAGFGFGSSFAGALLSGGGLGDALRAGMLGAFSGGITAGSHSIFSAAEFGLNVTYAAKVAAHGITQGLSRVARGDKFEHGFLSGLFSAVFTPGRESLFSRDPVLHTVSATLVAGTAAELGGGKFANGAATTAFITGFTHVALGMRESMVAQSKLCSCNSQGESVGFRGDGFKLGGGRFNWLDIFREHPSPLGGFQNGTGKFLFWGYQSGDTWDRLVEAYAGPHDFLNSGYWYDSMGNIDIAVASSPLASGFGELLNMVNVVIATPLVVTSMVPAHAVHDLGLNRRFH